MFCACPTRLEFVREMKLSNDAISSMPAWQVLVVFKTAPELCSLLQAVEEQYRRGREGGLHQRTRLDGPYADVLPWIQSQAVVFESGAKASCRDAHTASTVSFITSCCGRMTHTHQQVLLRLVQKACEASCKDPLSTPSVHCSIWCTNLNL